ncbi:MAG: hypothetical protein ABEJ27_06980 [Halodesulfurarchaeum sp.]
MPTTGDDFDMGEELAAQADIHQDAYQRTIEDARALAEEREADGWETLVFPAGHTATEPPEVGDTDRFGLVHVVPDNFADDFIEWFEPGRFPAFDVYRAKASGRVFLVTELLDPDEKLAVIIIANYELRDAQQLIETVKEEEVMYTHLQRLDGTHLGSFEHEAYEKFFPEETLLD